jgi:quercetin dioxygenase-like cupin family protein
MCPEARIGETEHGIAAAGDGWFVLNAREARWKHEDGRGARLVFEGHTEFPQVGASLFALSAGEAMGKYHHEADQEDFFVISGQALLIVEGRERQLRQWDFVHCPAGTDHMIVGAGDSPSAILAFGSREHQAGPAWGAYTVDETARRHGVGVERETADADAAYAGVPERTPTRYRTGWLPGD